MRKVSVPSNKVITHFMGHRNEGKSSKTNLFFTFGRVWAWLSEVLGAAVELFAWNHNFQGSFNSPVTV